MHARSIPANGTPANVIYGVDDDSILPEVLTPVETNIHTPYLMYFAPKGKGNVAHLLSGDTLLKMNGSAVIQNGNKYSTFNTPFVKMFNEKANVILGQRLIPDDAETASLRVYAELFTKEIDVYQRDALGNIEYEAGTTNPIITGTTEAQYVIYRMMEISEVDPFRQAKVLAGTNQNVDGSPSQLYPLYDIPGPYEGDAGRNFRFSFSCLNRKSATQVDQALINRVGSRLFRLSVREATPSNINGNILNTLKGSSGVTYSHARGARDAETGMQYDYRYMINRGYINKRPTAGLPAFPGPFDDFYIYDENMATLCTILGEAEGIDPAMVDPFTGLDIDGVKYTNVIIDDGTEGGEILNEQHFHNLMGGADGTMNNEVYDQLVRREMENFGEGAVHLLDMLRYPCSFFWDSGFTMATKEAMANFMGRRPDCTVVESPFVYNQPSNDIETETSMAIAIAGFMRAFPESTRYSTPALRGYIVGQDYLLNDESYLDRVPTSYHLASMMADYAGSTRLRSEFRFFDGGEHTIIDTGYDVSLPWKPNTVYENDYANGLIYAQSFDDHRFFYPSLRSIYNNPRSVLVGMLPALVCGDLIRVSQRVWAETTGNQTMSESEYIDYVTQKILNHTSDKYDVVTDIRPVVYFTEEDHAAGNQVTIDIYVGFQTTKVIHKVSIIAQRAGVSNGQ